ncbi:MAG: UDP-N-acetylmuramoyl-tripeptide--D-alanyl-D-alanine ligase, partial [Alphaproteobacteria bacterium]|nr:UDP-N-acetylmuramoyl-tripeptide--D-alanyl-D-alanine ligase [Alphaproteobacteria bacterium]
SVAFERGASAAIVDQPMPEIRATARLLRVADTLAALGALGAAARSRSPARIIAVTGSVGKTGTKEALRLALAASGPTCASAGGLNNHWGVPLSLARLPPIAGYGVFELGMNHAGEIGVLTKLVRPHVAVITTVEPAHLAFFRSVEAIANAKSEVFLGLEPGGAAVLNCDNPFYERLAAAARRAGAAEIIGFGADSSAAVRLVDCVLDADGSNVQAALSGKVLCFRLPLPGRHWAMNSLAVLAAAWAIGADLERAAAALAELEALPGRGRRYELVWQDGVVTLIDESYNASPAAVRAAIAVLDTTAPARARRIAVLGDMLELGEAAADFHRELAGPLLAAKVDRVFLVGALVEALHHALPQAIRGGLCRTADEAIPLLLRFLQPGDVVTVKGSRGVGLGRIVERLRAGSAHFEA